VARELTFGPFRLDTEAKRLWRGDREIALAPKALDVLAHLADHAGQLLTREQLFDALWPDTYVDDHALSVQIREIRKALGDDVHKPVYVETRPRRGYCFKADVRRTGLPVPETQYTLSGDVNIAYQVLGNGPLDLVFIMGWVSHLEYFWTEPTFARFLGRLAAFSRLILFDKRGTGLSDRVPVSQLPTLEQRMDDLRAVMDAAGSTRAVLCGVSEGGPMAALFAATYPEKTLGLVMIGSYAKRIRDAEYPWGPTEEEHERFLREIREHWGGPIGIEVRAPTLASDPRFREWWAAYLRVGASPGAAVALTKMNSEIDVRALLPLVRVPAVVIHRQGDRCLKVEEGRFIASRIPGARYVELPGEDHLPFVGDQDAILNEIEAFVARLRLEIAPERVLATVLAAGLCPPIEAPFRSCVAAFRGVGAQPGLATFDGPARAVRCAWALAQQAVRAGFDTRVGVHTGECERPEGPVAAGPAVEIAQAIRERAETGVVLCSATVRNLVAGSGIRFAPCGRLGQLALLRVEAA
jgi:pimeloyl-ACP methyl ester carboxylesterase